MYHGLNPVKFMELFVIKCKAMYTCSDDHGEFFWVCFPGRKTYPKTPEHMFRYWGAAQPGSPCAHIIDYSVAPSLFGDR